MCWVGLFRALLAKVTPNLSASVYGKKWAQSKTLYIDPKAEMVIARFASHPVAGNAANDPNSLPAFAKLGEYFLKQ